MTAQPGSLLPQKGITQVRERFEPVAAFVGIPNLEGQLRRLSISEVDDGSPTTRSMARDTLAGMAWHESTSPD